MTDRPSQPIQPRGLYSSANHPQSARWTAFLARRRDSLQSLGEVIIDAVGRKDTSHPAFCGCIDWHSSVHGVYALLTLFRLTQDERYRSAAAAVLQPDALARELDDIESSHLDHEIPYGFAWFLRMSREFEMTIADVGGIDARPIRELSDAIAARLAQHVESMPSVPLVDSVRAPEYQNISWATLCLAEWAASRGEAGYTELVADFCRSRLLPLADDVPLSLDQRTDEFFPAALFRLRTLVEVCPDALPPNWQSDVASTIRTLLPVIHPNRVHSAGLNFSRSWAFWTLYQATNDPVFRDSYVNHITTHMQHTQFWCDDYQQHGHWVPQFGVYAIALTFDAQDV